MKTRSPILIITYKRLDHLRELINSLINNYNSDNYDIFIFADGNKSIKDKEQVYKLREYLFEITHFKSINITLRAKNFGLKNNIVESITKILDDYESVIVLEDDLKLSKYFLNYMDNALLMYKNYEEVISIHGYSYPINVGNSNNSYFLIGADCWGWGTWKRGWKLFDNNSIINFLKIIKLNKIYKFNYNNSYPYFLMLFINIFKKNKSWAINWYASAFINKKLTLYPEVSLVYNNGMDSSGENCNNIEGINRNFIIDNNINLRFQKPVESILHFKKYCEFFNKTFSFKTIFKRKLKRLKMYE